MQVDMDTESVNQFKENLETFVEQSIKSHIPIKVTRCAGEAFVVMRTYDREKEQVTPLFWKLQLIATNSSFFLKLIVSVPFSGDQRASYSIFSSLS